VSADSKPVPVPHLLIISGVWPTPDRPSAGIYVLRRTLGLSHVVVAPSSYKGPVALRYLRLGVNALVQRGRFDGVEAHILFPTGLIGLAAARIRGVPLVIYAHGADVRITANANRVSRSLSRLVARNADAVVTNSAATRERVRALGVDAIIEPPGIDIERFRPSPRPTNRRILYLGGNQLHKGVDRAVGIADTMAGPGLDEVDPDQVADLMKEHDVVLVPSRAEPFGLVAAEAIASGRWVVATNVDGLREFIIDGVNGTLVSDGDFASAVHNVPDYDPFAVASTVQHLSVAALRSSLDQVWRSVISRRRSAKG
jgi:teichuronic acid biosynthesis glycosyltransferase TuaC